MKLTYTGSVQTNPIYPDLACTQGRLVLTDNNNDVIDYIEQTTFIVHDVQHLLFGIGYEQHEEDFITSLDVNNSSWISERNPSFNVKEWEELFIYGASDFFLSHVDLLGLQFVVTAELIDSYVTVDVTYL